MTTPEQADWANCRYLTCSVLPVRVACNCDCRFCFSKSSISSLDGERTDWASLDVEAYYRYARERGATRLVITGGGEPMLRPEDVLRLLRRGRPFFEELALFTNATFLTPELASELHDAGLSYVCFSRHHQSDERNWSLMGKSAPSLEQFFANVGKLRVRATCVMARGYVEHEADVWAYIDALTHYGIREFTFKHTYVAYPQSMFRKSNADRWAREHRVEADPFANHGTVVGSLPWGPTIRTVSRNHKECTVCHYREPTPNWELRHQIGRSLNLLSDGTVYGSLEDERSRLFQLRNSREPSA